MYCSCVQLSTLPKAGSVDPSEALTLIVILSYVCVLKEWISLLLFDTGLAEIGVPFMCLLHHYNLHFCTIQPISIFCNISKTRSVAPYSHQFINNFLIVLKGVEKSLYLDSQKRFECTAICWKYRVSYRLVRTVHAVKTYKACLSLALRLLTYSFCICSKGFLDETLILVSFCFLLCEVLNQLRLDLNVDLNAQLLPSVCFLGEMGWRDSGLML